MTSNFRIEHDFLGEKRIPAVAYGGVHTARAVDNFPISGTRISAMPDLVRAIAMVKKAATRANADLGAIDRQRAGAIILACDDLIEGKLLDEFVVDVIQGGAGTSTNMNANEGHRQPARWSIWAIEKGHYEVLHPNDHRQCLAEHQRCLPHFALRVAARGSASRACSQAMAESARRLRGQGRWSSRPC